MCLALVSPRDKKKSAYLPVAVWELAEGKAPAETPELQLSVPAR